MEQVLKENLLEIELITLVVKNLGVRCQDLYSGEKITFRPKHELWNEVSGQILKVKPSKKWNYAGTWYLSGELVSSNLDVRKLGLAPLRLKNFGMWDPKDEHWGELSEKLPECLNTVIAAGPRPMFEMEQIIPGEEPEDSYEDPILQASEFHGCGDNKSASRIMERILTEDLRCLDAHAHLGNWDFESNHVKRAKLHYEVGVRIGELSLENNFSGVLKWGMINNRPFLRCLHGYGLCLWRLGNFKEAKDIFKKMIWLNPTDNQGVRFLLSNIDTDKAWQPE